MEIDFSRCTIKSWAKKKQSKKYNSKSDFRKASPNGGRLRRMQWDNEFTYRWSRTQRRVEIKCEEETNPIEQYLNINNPNDTDIQSNLYDIINNTNPTTVTYKKCDNNGWKGSCAIWTIHYSHKINENNCTNINISPSKDSDFKGSPYFKIGPTIDAKDAKKGCTVVIKQKRKDIKYGLRRDGGLENHKDWYTKCRVTRRMSKQNISYIQKQCNIKHATTDWMEQNIESVYFSDESSIGEWQCSQCSFINFDVSFCDMCSKAFDYNHRNNQNSFHYSDAYKSEEISVTQRGTNDIARTDVFSTNDNDSYVAEAANYRSKMKNRYLKGREKNQFNQTIKETNMESFDVEISMVVTEYNEYKYVKERLFYNRKEGAFWLNVPMQLMNTKLHQCSLKIFPKKSELHNVKSVYFEPMITDFFVPIHTTEYGFIFKHELIPAILKNNTLFRTIKHCMRQCAITNIDSINFDRNLSIDSYNLYSVLFEYLPAMDILSHVLMPYIGYSQAISIKTKVKNAQIDKTKFETQSNHEWNPIDDKYNSSLLSIIRKPIPIRHKKHPLYQESESSSLSIGHKLFSDESDDTNDSSNTPPWPLFMKYLNGYPSDDTESDSDSMQQTLPQRNVSRKTKTRDTAPVLFKVPYTFCRNYVLSDDDPERDIKWWKHLKYKSKCKYRLNEKVKVKHCGYDFYWRDATISKVSWEGVTVEYSHGSEEFVSKNKFKSRLRKISAPNKETDKVKHNGQVMDRKRNAYSKAGRNYNFFH